MSERRPHWDDKLIEAVRVGAVFDGTSVSRLFDSEVYTVIAAVEDWQEREKLRCQPGNAYHCVTHNTQWLDDESDRCEYKRMVDAEQAIRRVRDYITGPRPEWENVYADGYEDALRFVAKLLEGDKND